MLVKTPDVYICVLIFSEIGALYRLIVCLVWKYTTVICSRKHTSSKTMEGVLHLHGTIKGEQNRDATNVGLDSRPQR